MWAILPSHRGGDTHAKQLQYPQYLAPALAGLVPVFAMFWGYLLLDEGVTVKMVAGALCILTGIGLTTYQPGRKT